MQGKCLGRSIMPYKIISNKQMWISGTAGNNNYEIEVPKGFTVLAGVGLNRIQSVNFSNAKIVKENDKYYLKYDLTASESNFMIELSFFGY